MLSALLCITMWITCVKRRRACAHIGEMLGIVLPGRARNRAFTWESAIRALCMEKNGNCPHATPRQRINKPNVYRKYIQS